MDTIFAPATARGKSGVAVVRISGPAAHVTASRLCALPKPRQAGLRHLRGSAGDVLDHALVLVFEEDASFTGEPVVELHLHGSLAVVDVVLGELSRMPELRAAEAGEFTRQALENNRLDLSEVEGLGDLLAAETEAQRIQAQRALEGALGVEVERWRAQLIEATALVEATIDFSDEDVPDEVMPHVHALTQAVTDDLQRHLDGAGVAERVREGFEVALVGAPNLGKSTLLNRLAGREAALTSEVAGTTRDVIEVRMDIDGLPVTLVDTAGLRDSEDTVEKLGIARARERAERADIRVLLVARSGEIPLLAPQKDDLVLIAKDDLGEEDAPSVSGQTGQGVDYLLTHIGERLTSRSAQAGLASRERHRIAMSQAVTFLKAAESGIEAEMIAEDLRFAARALGSLTGHVDVEDVLGEIFSSFCIGK